MVTKPDHDLSVLTMVGVLESDTDLLDIRERHILDMHYRQARTDVEIERSFGLTQARIRQIIASAERKLAAAGLRLPPPATPDAPWPMAPRLRAATTTDEVSLLGMSARTLVFDRPQQRQVMWIEGVVVLPVGAEVELVSPNVNVQVVGIRLLAGTTTWPVQVCLDVQVPAVYWDEHDRGAETGP